MVAVATLFEWWSVPPYLFNPGLDVAVQNFIILTVLLVVKGMTLHDEGLISPYSTKTCVQHN